VSATVSQNWVKGDLRIFYQNVMQLSLFSKNIFLFGTFNFFGEIWGNFLISPKQGDEAKNPIAGY